MKFLNGLILTGGESSRMGSEKGLLLFKNKPWFMEIAERVEPYCEETYISIRKDQEPLYMPQIIVFNFIFDQPELSISGPARGLLSAHLFNPGRDWLVVSTDMLNVTDEVFSIAKKAWKENNSHDAFLFKDKGKYEPLCGVYTSTGLKKLMEKMVFTKNYSLVTHLNTMNICELVGKKLPLNTFKSFNTADDLKGLKST